MHHAHDAYLNVVVGDIYRNKFTDAYYILEFVKQHRNSYSLKMEYRKKITGSSQKNIWEPEKDKKRIVKTINKPSILVVAESYEDKGQLFNATIVGKSDIKKDSTYLPLKQNNRLSDIQKYGAYGSLQGSYFFIVKHTMKKKRVTTIEYVPLHLKEQLHQNRQALTNHCVENLQLKDPEIVLERVLTKALISINGFRYTINGRTGKQIILQPAVQPFWKIEDINALKVIIGNHKKDKLFNGNSVGQMKKDELLKEYSKVMEKLLKPPYSKRINVPSVLNNSVGVLKSKNNEEIAELMIEVLELLKASAKTANLKIIDGKENAGKTLISKDISKLSDCKIIYQSITGIYEREVNLLENGLAYGSRDKSGEA